jgi:mono/diheme cytochrome c family protein
LGNDALDATLERGTKELKNPIQPNDENLITGVRLYAENCAICHGASDAKPSNLAQGFYIEAPQLAKDGVEDDPEAASFWKVKAWNPLHGDAELYHHAAGRGDLENRDVSQTDG